MKEKINIRSIEKTDNPILAKLIRNTFDEFMLTKEGTVYTDPTTDDLFSLFNQENAVYWVAEQNNVLLGGCGIYPTVDLPSGYAEVVKFYLAPDSRGKGIGRLLLQKSIESANKLGYSKLYLESFPQLKKAVSLYEKIGFVTIDKCLGNSGHYACTIWMEIELKSYLNKE
jgi:putative acetyltransferase